MTTRFHMLPDHPLKPYNPGIRQPQSTIKVIGHDTDAVVNRILQAVEYWTIERVADAEHQSFAGMNHRTKAGHEGELGFRHSFPVFKNLESRL